MLKWGEGLLLYLVLQRGVALSTPSPQGLTYLFEWWAGRIREMRGNLYSLSTCDVPGSMYIIFFNPH